MYAQTKLPAQDLVAGILCLLRLAANPSSCGEASPRYRMSQHRFSLLPHRKHVRQMMVQSQRTSLSKLWKHPLCCYSGSWRVPIGSH